MDINYEKCSRYVKDELGITLFPYQEEMLQAFCTGKEVRSARCVGRSFVADCVRQYVTSLLEKNNYTVDPDVCFPYHCAVNHHLMSKKQIQEIRNSCSAEIFKQEYMCE